MHGQEFFTQALVYLTAAVIAVPVAQRLGLGSVLGYLIAGMMIGPFGLHLVGSEGESVMHFAEFGVVMMLFVVGLELQPSLLWRMRNSLLGLGGLQVGVTTVAIAGVGLLFGLSWSTALAVGMILALSSTAIVLQTLAEKGLTRTDAGQSAFAVLLFQDIAVIPMLALMPLLAVTAVSSGGGHGSGDDGTWVAGLPGWGHGLVVLGVILGIVLVGRFLARHLLRFIARTRLREIFTAAALLLVVGVSLLMNEIGLSPALGAFVAGVVLANNEYRHELEGDIAPFKGLLLGVFFIAVGASVDFGLIYRETGLILGLVGILMALKFTVLFVLGRVFRMGLDQNLLFAFALAQSGEFAFVLFSFATQTGVISEATAGPLVAVVAMSMALTPIFLAVSERLFQPRIGTREQAKRDADVPADDAEVIIAGYGNFGSIVGRLLTANGVKPTVFEYDSDRVEVLRRLGFTVYYGDASRHDLLSVAGADRAKVMVIALDDHDSVMRMVDTVKKHFPHLKLVVRAGGRYEAYALLNAGVDHIYRETLDTSLRMGVDVLRSVGFRGFQAHRASVMFRDRDEKSLRDLAAMHHDQKGYVNAARETIEDLERTLLQELRSNYADRDAGWDTMSLITEYGDKENESG